MSEQSMIERMAGTLHAIAIANGGISRGPADMRADARALIAAMREPTEAMLVAAARCRTDPSRFGNSSPDDTMGPEWRAMIDAALAEEG